MTVAELRDDLEKARISLLAYLASIGDPDFHTSPNGHWSVAEHADHLRRSEGLFARMLGRIIEKGRSRGGVRTGTPPDFEAKHEVLHVFDDGMSAIPAFPGTEPFPGLERVDLMEGLAQSRVELQGVIDAALSNDLSGITFPHPYLGHLTMYDWLVFVAVHERAHVAQMRRHRES